MEKGGATVFPFLRIYVPPKKGSAVLWHNLSTSGDRGLKIIFNCKFKDLIKKIISNFRVFNVSNSNSLMEINIPKLLMSTAYMERVQF